MARYVYWCPRCGTWIAPKNVPMLNRGYKCPTCEAPLRVDTPHTGLTYGAGLIIALVTCCLAGLRGAQLVVISILGSPVAFLALGIVIGLIWPSKLELRPPTDFPLRFPNRPPD
jgi:DNA-directed RNA polymerase subunit RPC12/RpoP